MFIYNVEIFHYIFYNRKKTYKAPQTKGFGVT